MSNTGKTLTVTDDKATGIWKKTRNLLLLQVKLWFDAIRDFALMPVGLACYVLDLLKGTDHNSYWERLMKWGRQSDRHINLFQHHSFDEEKTVTVDDVADIVEDALKSGVKSSGNRQQLVEAVKKRVKERFGQNL
ncbi:hypothetical protein [Kangiella shandongensis]|uniref:hypothetical protein n=1 Tax=Kangiella shandongensis TaxID=2763258 RepID=UPI001CC01C10|nr:hypothetical protein [Kangiella shandongensis]